MNIYERIAAWFRPAPRVTIWFEDWGIPDGFAISKAHPYPVFAVAGEKVVCSGADQHEIATFSEGVQIGQLWSRDVLTDWKQPEPEPGTKLPLMCSHCRCAWIWPGNHLHFKDGWR